MTLNENYLKSGQLELKKKGIDNIPYEEIYLSDKLKDQYIEDVEQCQLYAEENRDITSKIICKNMKWKIEEEFDCSHNYFDKENNILRKGSISAYKDSKVIIPINMKEGCLIGVGKGNKEWNYSTPHGSGRLFKRSDVANYYTLNQFKNDMEGVYSSCITKDTLDESPYAYRSLDEIKEVLDETVEIQNLLKPTYSFKAGGKNDNTNKFWYRTSGM